jgi:hypothetical protein
VDVKRAAELYAQGWTLSEIGAELGVQSNIIHDHLRRAGVTMRPVDAPTRPNLQFDILRAMTSRHVLQTSQVAICGPCHAAATLVTG